MSIESGVGMNEIVERFNQWLDDYLAQGYEFPYKTYYDSEYQIEIVDFDSTLEISMFDSFEGIRDDITGGHGSMNLRVHIEGHVEYFQDILMMLDIDLSKIEERCGYSIDSIDYYTCELGFDEYSQEMLYIFLYVLIQRKRKEDIAKEKEALDIVLERIGG